MSTTGIRALHWVFKIGNRPDNIRFFKDILGMTVLRHEEFEQGCEATCNGPYNGKWSKTMIGYGHEDTNFVIELTYNYEIGGYTFAEDLRGFHIESETAYQNIEAGKYHKIGESDNTLHVKSPDGYPFFIRKPKGEDNIVSKVSIAVSDLYKSLDYWRNILGMSVYHQHDKSAILGYARDQCKLEIIHTGQPIIHESGIGRIAFACPWDHQVIIRDKVKNYGGKIVNDLIELPTPGKATVRVLILLDPDGYEICFVGDEGFRDLSAIDPTSDEGLRQSMEKDKSSEWFAKKGKSKTQA